MDLHCTTLGDIFDDDAGRGLTALLLLLFDAGVAYGMGRPWEQPMDNSAAALVSTVKARWHADQSAMRHWQQTEAAPGNVPDWALAAIEAQAAQVAK